MAVLREARNVGIYPIRQTRLVDGRYKVADIVVGATCNAA